MVEAQLIPEGSVAKKADGMRWPADPDILITPPESLRRLIESRDQQNGQEVNTSYSDNMRACRDVVLPRLCQEYNYAATLPLNEIQEACAKSPRNFASVIEGWFAGGLEFLDDLRLHGFAVERTLTQDIIKRHRGFLSANVETDQLFESQETLPEVGSQLQYIRQAYRNGDVKPQAPLKWQDYVLARATQRWLIQDGDYVLPRDILLAARFINASLTKIARAKPGELLTDWPHKIALVTSYLQDVAYMQRRGVTNALAAARYHEATILDDLEGEFAPYYLTRGLINTVLCRSPMTPRRSLQTILDDRERIIDIISDQGHSIDIDSATILAYQTPRDMTVKVNGFLAVYVPLIAEYRGMDNFEDWMAARAVVRTDKPEARINLYRNMARKGVFEISMSQLAQWTHRRPRGNQRMILFAGLTPDIAQPEVEDASPILNQLEEILEHLDPLDRMAVAVAYKLDHAPLDEENLAKQLGVSSIKAYVDEQILPALRQYATKTRIKIKRGQEVG